MPTLTDYQSNKPGQFVLFKGDSGAGKTVAALSYPNVYIFDMDRKMPGVALKHFKDRTDIAWDQYNDIYALSDKIREFQGNCPYETLVFDSLTHLSTMTLNAVGDAKGESVVDMIRNAKQRRSGNTTIELMGVDYYNGETNFLVRYFLDALRVPYAQSGNPKHIILIAHVVTTESQPDLKTKLITRSSSLVTAGRKVSAIVPTVFDDSYHFCIRDSATNPDKQDRVCLTQAKGEEFAKCSYNLPEIIVFTNGSFYEKITEYITF